MQVWMRNTLIVLLSLFVLIAAAAGFLYHRWFLKPYQGNKTVIIHLYPGQTLQSLMLELQQRKLAPQGYLFKEYLHLVTSSKHLKTGEYELKRGMNLQDLLHLIEKGKVKIRRFAIIQGWTADKLLKILGRKKAFKPELLTDQIVRKALGIKRKSIEGLFYPATYRYYWGSSPMRILKKSHLKMQSYLKSQWAARESGLPYKNAYQALIVASLIQKETHAKEERPLIARVILNRLKKNMRLQVDPTVIYAWKDTNLRYVTLKMLDIDSPYNTYRRKGLPPTPICLPLGAAIRAALHPATSNALYYVATGDGIHHHFSDTYKQHLQYARDYRKLMRERKKDSLLGFPVTLKQLRKYWHSHCLQVHYWLPLVAGLGNLTEQGDWLLFPINDHPECRVTTHKKKQHKSMHYEQKTRAAN